MTNLKFKKGDIVYVIRTDDPESESSGGWSVWNNVPLEIVEVDTRETPQWPYTLNHPTDEHEQGLFAESELALA